MSADWVEVAGPIAFLGVRTVDGRLIWALTVARLPVPILAPVTTFGAPLVDMKPLGFLDHVTFRPDGVVWARGKLAPQYALSSGVGAGIDCGDMTVHYETSFSGEPGADQEWLQVASCSLLAVTLSPNGTQAWPDAVLRPVDVPMDIEPGVKFDGSHKVEAGK